MAVHVRADDVHLVGPRRADLGAVHLFASAVGGRLGVERAQLLVRLAHWVVVDAGTGAQAARPPATLRGGNRVGIGRPWRRCPCGRVARRCREGVLDPLGVGAAVTLELRLDPVHCLAIALGALATIAELREALDGGLVFFEIEPADQRPDRIGGGRRRRGGRLLRGDRDGQQADGAQTQKNSLHDGKLTLS